jgi:Transposase DDE domain group 1
VTKRMRRHWPKTRMVWRGDSHYGRVEAMEWADDNDYIFGLPGNAVLLGGGGRRQSALLSCDQ